MNRINTVAHFVLVFLSSLSSSSILHPHHHQSICPAHLQRHSTMTTTPPHNLKPMLKSAMAPGHDSAATPHFVLPNRPESISIDGSIATTSPPPSATLSSHTYPHSALASPRGSISSALPSSTSAFFPRTHTQSSTVGPEGKYRRKVGFETFDDLPDTLFTFTSQVS